MKTKGLYTMLLAVGLLAYPMTATAQVAVSVSAGPTFATVTGDDINDDDVDSRTGFFVGGSLGIPLSEILSFGTGAYYVQKGASVDVDDADAALEIDYLEIPALLQVQVTGPDRPVGVSLMAGPTFGFKLSCEVAASDDVSSASLDCDEADALLEIDDVKGFDFGLLFGGGLSFAASETMSVFVDGGIDVGLTSIADELEGSEDVDAKNQAWFLGAGVSWIVGG